MQDKKKILHRLKIVKGHLDMVTDMVKRNKNNIEIVQQSKAIIGALRNLNVYIIENHLRKCIFQKMNKGQQAKALKEIVSMYTQDKLLPVS